MENPATAAYLLVATNTAGSFSLFVGSPFDGDQYDDEKKSVAKGFAFAWSLGIAVAASFSLGSYTPMFWWAIVTALFWGLYEIAPERLWRDY